MPKPTDDPTWATEEVRLDMWDYDELDRWVQLADQHRVAVERCQQLALDH